MLWYFTAVLTNKIKHVNPFYFLVHQFYVPIYLPYILNLMIPNAGSSKYAVFKRYQLTVFDFIKPYFQNISCLHEGYFNAQCNSQRRGKADGKHNYRFFTEQGKHPMVALQKLILYTLLDQAQPQFPHCLYCTHILLEFKRNVCIQAISSLPSLAD